VKISAWTISIVLAGALAWLVGHGSHPTGSTEPADGGGARRILYYVDPMHPGYRSDRPGFAPDCGMPLKPVYSDGAPGPRDASASARQTAPDLAPPGAADVVSIDPTAQQLFGIAVVPVGESTEARRVRVPGRVTADESRVHRVSLSVEGFVGETYDDTVGRRVRKGQRLAAVHSQEFLSAVTAYLGAIERAQEGAAEDTAAKTVARAAAKQHWSESLRNLGMSESQIEEIDRTRKVPQVIYLISPVDGFILERHVAAGQRFERHTDFYRIADLSHVWIVAELLGGEDQQLHPGAPARVRLPGESLIARVADILPPVDPLTRAAQLRLEADNPHLALRPDMLVSVDLSLPAPRGLSVPADAVVDSGLSQRVYVRVGAGSFEPRRVEVGERFGDRVQILTGLAAGEQVVASGTFLVDSETRLRAGTP
jgi:RND family efflux transporter MFP subunit